MKSQSASLNAHLVTRRSRLSTSATCLAAAVAVLCSACAPVITKKADDQFNRVLGNAAKVQAAPPLAEQAGEGVRGGAANADRLAATQKVMPVSRRATLPYIGSQMVPATSEDRLPSVFHEPFTIDFSDAAADGNGSGGVSLSTAMARVSRLTNVPIRVQADVYTMTGAEPGATAPTVAPVVALPGMPMPMPSPALTNVPGASSTVTLASSSGVQTRVAPKAPRSEPVSTVQPMTVRAVEMKYSGTMSGYLNRVTDRLGLSWEYRDATIVISRFTIESHEVFAMTGSAKYSLGGSGGSVGSAGGTGGGSSSSSSSDVSESGESNALASLEKTVAAMITEVPGSTVTRSDGSGRFVVKTSREMQSRVRDYIKAENSSMRRQAQIQFDIYSVTIDDSDQHGVDWNAALSTLRFPALNFGVTAPPTLTDATAAVANVNILSGVAGTLSKTLGNSSLILQALTQNGYSAQHRPVSLVALNRQWATQSKTGTEFYLSETTPGPASSSGVGAPGLKTASITTGDRYVVMPQIFDDNSIMLKFDLTLSDLLGLFDVTVGSGQTAQKIQAPKTSSVAVRQPVSVRPGEVVAITGLSRDVASSNTRRIAEGAAVGLGGSKTVSTKREYFLIFVRAVVL